MSLWTFLKLLLLGGLLAFAADRFLQIVGGPDGYHQSVKNLKESVDSRNEQMRLLNEDWGKNKKGAK